jgi:hypothetical protein
MPQFVQTLDQSLYTELSKIANDNQMTIQEFIQNIIIPQWLKNEEFHKDLATYLSELARVAFSYQIKR